MNQNTTFKSITQKVIACSVAVTLIASPVVSGVHALAAPISIAGQSVNASEVQTPIQYQINARLDEKNMHILGSETVMFRNTTEDTMHELVFHTFADANRSKATQPDMFKRTNEEILKDNPKLTPDDFLGGIDMKKVTANGQSLTYENKNQALIVSLAQGLKPGESITLQLEFDVKIPYGSERLSYYKDIINGAHAFPVLAVYDEAKHQWNKTPYSTIFETDYYTSSDFEVHLGVPDKYQVLMPGTITTQQDKEAGRKIVSTVANNTREFVFFASPNYKVESVTRDGLTVEYYYFDNVPDKKKVIHQYIDQAFKAIQFFNDKYGKYPYPEFRIAESYVEGVAVEFSRVIQMGLKGNNADAAHDNVFVHEIAHQWFHALIGNNSETESFLDEGFADFSMIYFTEKQGDSMNGFKSLQYDDSSFDEPIASTNKEVGDNANPVYYGKGRQAIYQLYRLVGEDKFDAFMQEYFKRYEYKNATIVGLLQTIEDTLGIQARDEMDKALHEPNFVLKSEYQLTETEKADYMREQFKEMYHASMSQIPGLPYETMSRIMDKVYAGEPLTIVLSDQVGAKAKKQQEAIKNQIEATLSFTGIKPTVITERQVLKQKMTKELAVSNIIVIGSAKTNGLIQALKPSIIQKSKDIDWDWKKMMNKKDGAGAYIIKHPYNQNRLLLHFYWNGDTLTDGMVEPFGEQALTALNFTSDYYQYYEMNRTGKVTLDKKTANPMAKFFAQE
ncbi:M1 family metallopeptidase [Paenibacillus motobuensis]|uniref:M1 family metallopeptidase n=1 Tax=Paenibacillus TaxID=44249 RepID=UPI00203C8D2E|nr:MULTISPECIES: M1 family metallopeptidase [Paenibacillus]MCM3039762.1 M1 family metallopeptidase [Paenibacillus lutimineralis]MCM3646866.1 M1 family metallopeptidase [Paenibacillus motobuensis]